ncbi:mas-related G-protein coupled receptor member X4-like [Dromiciops gliroides]|uniref:mas-related G-protein coupled receptor member X4-like n=1 Tax=Dromiciops gliroides TaxID=33562 RepID=UPI001CC38558|nr:mas-related G-protein coupled receptor member X4-like [Dromiciops gliroides]
MSASPTPEQWEHPYFKATRRSAIEALTPGEFGWICILSWFIDLVAMLGNSIVLLLLGFHIPRNAFSVYILNLTEANVFFLFSSFLHRMPSSGIFFIQTDTSEFLLNATSFFYTVALSLLTAISTERCLAVLFPSWYLRDRPKHTSAAVCIVLWVLPGLFWAADFVLCDSRVICFKVPNFPVVWLIHFTPVLGVSSLTLLLSVQCSSQHRQRPRLYLLVLLRVLVFLLCGLPLGIHGGMKSLGLDIMSDWLPSLLARVNCIVNPFIYFLLGSRRPRIGREPLRVVLQRALADEHELEGRRKDTRHTRNTETTVSR